MVYGLSITCHLRDPFCPYKYKPHFPNFLPRPLISHSVFFNQNSPSNQKFKTFTNLSFKPPCVCKITR
ncbi:hypothetical protein L1987_56399 [Smallanthus sonchifolius]|uniref:Uncharacterized protein n=1 Tax=Smallanthus sonchifolius TaxID=185202 RepID=A0ACB9ECQ2_9ASTR|nr:hypothetical protein L1987_56399 [Smallanthus sonchifolius]